MFQIWLYFQLCLFLKIYQCCYIYSYYGPFYCWMMLQNIGKNSTGKTVKVKHACISHGHTYNSMLGCSWIAFTLIKSPMYFEIKFNSLNCTILAAFIVLRFFAGISLFLHRPCNKNKCQYVTWCRLVTLRSITTTLLTPVWIII